MKYIYDLKELDKLGPAHLPAAQFAALIAIAERLEGLAEAQKPRFVEFATASGGNAFVNPSCVCDVVEFNESYLNDNPRFLGSVLLTTTGTAESVYAIKGTLPEVLAKLRGDK